ncbi:MAG: lysophospholipid acyltransferase family protein [Candidatus Omnitrophota bacterium]
MIYEIARFLSALILKIPFRFEITGREVFPLRQPFILASNHISNLDPIVLGVACPAPLYYLAKEELFKQKLFGHFLKAINVIPVKRDKADMQSVRIALKVLETRSIVIFPQGTRGAPYDNFKAGVGFFS